MKQGSHTSKGTALHILFFPMTVTRIGTWNVRTLYETEKSSQVAMKMDKYGVKALGLS